MIIARDDRRQIRQARRQIGLAKTAVAPRDDLADRHASAVTCNGPHWVAHHDGIETGLVHLGVREPKRAAVCSGNIGAHETPLETERSLTRGRDAQPCRGAPVDVLALWLSGDKERSHTKGQTGIGHRPEGIADHDRIRSGSSELDIIQLQDRAVRTGYVISVESPLITERQRANGGDAQIGRGAVGNRSIHQWGG